MKIIQINGNIIDLGDKAFIHQSIDADEEITLLDNEVILQCEEVGLLTPIKSNDVICIHNDGYNHFYGVVEVYDYKAKLENI